MERHISKPKKVWVVNQQNRVMSDRHIKKIHNCYYFSRKNNKFNRPNQSSNSQKDEKIFVQSSQKLHYLSFLVFTFLFSQQYNKFFQLIKILTSFNMLYFVFRFIGDFLLIFRTYIYLYCYLRYVIQKIKFLKKQTYIQIQTNIQKVQKQSLVLEQMLQNEYEEIEQKYKKCILKLFNFICMDNIVHGFNMIKVSSQLKTHSMIGLSKNQNKGIKSLSHYQYQVQIKRNANVNLNVNISRSKRQYLDIHKSQKGELLCRALCHVVNNKKKMVVKWLNSINNNTKYWKTKSCILMLKIVNPHIKQWKIQLFNKLISSPLQEEEYQQETCQYLKIHINLIYKIISIMKYRLLTHSFNMILLSREQQFFKNNRDISLRRQGAIVKNDKSYMMRSVRNDDKIWNITALESGLSQIIRKIYRQFFNSLNNKLNKSILKINPQYDEQQQILQINQIKSIIATNLQTSKKNARVSPISQKASKRFTQFRLQRSIEKIQEFVERKRQKNMFESFKKIRCLILDSYNYNYEMIQKLEAEIVQSVLQHEFESL